MKNNMKKLRLALFSALVCLFLQSCNDFLDVDPKHAALLYQLGNIPFLMPLMYLCRHPLVIT